MIKYRQLIQCLTPWYDYRKHAPKNAKFPYRVLLERTNVMDDVSTLFFDIDYWDKAETYSKLEEMIETDIGDGYVFNSTGLNGRVFHIPNEIGFHVYLNNIIQIDDPERELKRVKCTYEARYVYGGKK